MSDLSAFSPAGDTATLAVTGTSGRVALTAKPATAEITIIVKNVGANIAFIALGTVTVVATTASMPVGPGESVVLSTNYTQNTYIAAITGSSTTTLYITSGTGLPYGFGSAAISGGGETVAVSSVIPGTGATNLGKAEDAAHTSGDVGIEMLGVRKDTAAAFGADGDYTPIRTDQYGDVASLVVDSTGAAVTYLASVNGGTPVTHTGYSFLNIAAGQATTTVKSGAGVLHAIVFNGPATASNTTTVYDNTAASGTVIAIPLATAVVMPVTVLYDLAFSTGLTIITATANGANMTVVYR